MHTNFRNICIRSSKLDHLWDLERGVRSLDFKALLSAESFGTLSALNMQCLKRFSCRSSKCSLHTDSLIAFTLIHYFPSNTLTTCLHTDSLLAFTLHWLSSLSNHWLIFLAFLVITYSHLLTSQKLKSPAFTLTHTHGLNSDFSPWPSHWITTCIQTDSLLAFTLGHNLVVESALGQFHKKYCNPKQADFFVFICASN